MAGGERWAANERLIDSSFTKVTEAIVAAADLGGATRVLDVGCGTGTLLEAALAADAAAVGVDISPPMVEAAKRRVPEATVVVADAQTADLLAEAPGAPFDRGRVALRCDVLRRPGRSVREHPRRVRRRARELAFACWRSEETAVFMSGLAPLAARMDIAARCATGRLARAVGTRDQRADRRHARPRRLDERDRSGPRSSRSTTRSTAATAWRNGWRWR